MTHEEQIAGLMATIESQKLTCEQWQKRYFQLEGAFKEILGQHIALVELRDFWRERAGLPTSKDIANLKQPPQLMADTEPITTYIKYNTDTGESEDAVKMTASKSEERNNILRMKSSPCRWIIDQSE